MATDDIEGDEWLFDIEADGLSSAERKQIALRLYNDKYVCEGDVNDKGGVEPRLDHNGLPVLLRVDGTGLGDLIDALEQDEREVQEYLAQLAATKKAA